MRPGFYRHANALDAYILVLKVQHSTQRYSILKIEWFVRGRSLGIKQTVRVEAKDYGNWKSVDSEGNPLRYSNEEVLKIEEDSKKRKSELRHIKLDTI